jgi:hypothetical protein
MDSLTHDDSEAVYSANLNLFQPFSTNVGVLQSEYTPIFPQTLDDISPISFKYQGSNHYVDLYNNFLHCEAKITKNGGKALEATDSVTISEDFANACFASADMLINDMHVYRGNNLFPYQGHLKDLLSYGAAQKSTELSAQLWYEDTVQNNFTSSANSGYSKRFKLTTKSKTFDFIKKINIPLFEQARPLLPHTDFSLILRKTSPKFCLDGSEPVSTESTDEGGRRRQTSMSFP